MPSYRRTVVTLGALGAAAALIAGCSSTENGSGSPASTTPTSARVSTSTSTSSSPSSSASSSASGGDLAEALLTAAEVGTGYTASARGSEGSPLPCTPSKPPLFTQVPPKEKVQQSYANSGDTVEISETLADFDADSGAQQAYTVGSTGFTCSSGTLGGKTVRIVKRAGGAPSSGGVDEFAAWDFAAGDLKGTAVLVRQGEHITALTFVASGTAGNDVPVGAIVDKAIAKVNAH